MSYELKITGLTNLEQLEQVIGLLQDSTEQDRGTIIQNLRELPWSISLETEGQAAALLQELKNVGVLAKLTQISDIPPGRNEYSTPSVGGSVHSSTAQKSKKRRLIKKPGKGTSIAFGISILGFVLGLLYFSMQGGKSSSAKPKKTIHGNRKATTEKVKVVNTSIAESESENPEKNTSTKDPIPQAPQAQSDYDRMKNLEAEAYNSPENDSLNQEYIKALEDNENYAVAQVERERLYFEEKKVQEVLKGLNAAFGTPNSKIERNKDRIIINLGRNFRSAREFYRRAVGVYQGLKKEAISKELRIYSQDMYMQISVPAGGQLPAYSQWRDKGE